GYLFGELGRGAACSAALTGAIAKGYPEPDPRDDLSGMDVARKALILGRLLGFTGELEDIAVESLVPDGAERLGLDRFLASLEQFDATWAKRVAAARARGRYVRAAAAKSPRPIPTRGARAAAGCSSCVTSPLPRAGTRCGRHSMRVGGYGGAPSRRVYGATARPSSPPQASTSFPFPKAT